jgi:DNA segregation ATPase FtsK/SpoIIIE-like protein
MAFALLNSCVSFFVRATLTPLLVFVYLNKNGYTLFRVKKGAIMRQYSKNRIHIPFAREVRLLLFGVSLIFLTLALITYHAQDSSWFYASTQAQPIENKAGVAGALVSAFLFYFFGLSVFALLGMLFFVVYLFFAQRSWKDEWERVGAFIVLTISCAALCRMHGIGGSYPGGLVGYGVQMLLSYFFDVGITFLFLYVCVMISVVLIFRISWIWLARFCVRGVSLLVHALTSKERLWAPAYHLSKKIAYSFSYPFIKIIGFGKKMYDGSLVSDEHYAVSEFDGDLDDRAYVADSDLFSEQKYFCSTGPAADSIRQTDFFGEQETAAKQKNERVCAHTIAASAIQQQIFPQTSPGTPEDSVTQKMDAVITQPVKPYALPDCSIFIGGAQEKHDKQIPQELQERARLLEEKLERFGVQGKVTALKYGPVVTLFEYQPEIDTKLSKILALEDDLALALEAVSIRILAPIPGRSVVGFEVANQRRLDVAFAPIVRSKEYQEKTHVLPLILGQDTIGHSVVIDLVKMPHLLIAGSTGSGKSVALNGMLMSLLCQLSPDDLKLILIDPKRLEFASYADIAHLVFPVITDALQATMALQWVVHEMEERYEKMAACGVRTIADYRDIQQATDKLPYIVVVIDELADLMMTAGKECQELITRITQMARAAGIHLIVATQRPSVDVITGLIKANFPSRISFRVASKIDSRTILDCAGADKLLGRGDMLFLDASSALLRRVHGAYVSDAEIARVIKHIRAERSVCYQELHAQLDTCEQASLTASDDVLLGQVKDFLAQIDEVSISLLQRKFRIGYNRSARIIDMLELHGMIMPADGSKTRKVIHPKELANS